MFRTFYTNYAYNWRCVCELRSRRIWFELEHVWSGQKENVVTWDFKTKQYYLQMGFARQCSNIPSIRSHARWLRADYILIIIIVINLLWRTTAQAHKCCGIDSFVKYSNDNIRNLAGIDRGKKCDIAAGALCRQVQSNELTLFISEYLLWLKAIEGTEVPWFNAETRKQYSPLSYKWALNKHTQSESTNRAANQGHRMINVYTKNTRALIIDYRI